MRHLYLLTIFAILLYTEARKLKIGSFNIQIFGQKKSEKTNVVEVLEKILTRYDLVAVLEIRDKTEEVFKEFFNEMNGKSEFDLSDGRVLDYLKGSFERPPYLIDVKPKDKDIPKFTLITVHLKPTKVVDEMDSLYELTNHVIEQKLAEDILLAGDMNADCGYLSKKKLLALKFRTDTKFEWLISDDKDTTVARDKCAYDRFIVNKNKLSKKIVKDSGIPFNFTKEHDLDIIQNPWSYTRGVKVYGFSNN